MNKKHWKCLPAWLAVSAVLIIAGIVLMALLGFNTSSDKPQTDKLEVKYNVVVSNDTEMLEKLDSICEDAMSANGISYCDRLEGEGMTDDNESILYVFTCSVSQEVKDKVESDIAAKIAADAGLSGELVDVYTAWHSETLVSGAERVWRGAIAVGIVVALVYVGFRFGIGCALTGLTLAVHDALLTLALLALCRVPVYATAPVVYAMVAALLSVAFWLIVCIKLRAVVKGSDAGVLDAEEAVTEARAGAWKLILLAAVITAVALGAMSFAALGVMAYVLPMLISVLAALYSSLLLGPSLHIYVKRGFDKHARTNRRRYVGKSKQSAE